VLGTSNLDKTSLSLSYDRSDAIFKIELFEDENSMMQHNGGSSLLSTCAIPGMAVPDEDDGSDNEAPYGSSSLAIAFRNSPVLARAIVSSSYLKPAIHELIDLPGASCCTIGLSPEGIEMGAVGINGECLVSLPSTRAAHLMGHNSRDETPAFISLECNPPKLHARSYPLHSFVQGMRGLEVANETCISMNELGMIAIQHQVLDKVGKGEPNFVDFIMGSIQEDDEDTEGESISDVEMEAEIGEYKDIQYRDPHSHSNDNRRSQITQENSNNQEAFSVNLRNDKGDHDEDSDSSKSLSEQQTKSPRTASGRKRRIMESQESKQLGVNEEYPLSLPNRRRRNRQKIQEYVNVNIDDEHNDTLSNNIGGKKTGLSEFRKEETTRGDDSSTDTKKNGKSQNLLVDHESKRQIPTKGKRSRSQDPSYQDNEDINEKKDSVKSRSEEITSSPELLYGDTSLNGSSAIGRSLLFSSGSRKKMYNYSDDDTDDDDEF